MDSYIQLTYMQSYTKKLLFLFLIIFILFIFFFLGIGNFREQLASFSSIITAWVTINPLEVDVSAPTEVKIDRTFIVRARIENKGETKIDGVKAEILLPDELELVRKDKEQRIEVLRPGQKRFISWPVKGRKVGNYIISVKASGELQGELISAEDITMVEIRKEIRPRNWFYGLLDYFQKWFSY